MGEFNRLTQSNETQGSSFPAHSVLCQMGHHEAQNYYVRAQRPSGGLDGYHLFIAPINEDFDEDVYAQWADLDHTPVQLWRSYPICTTLIYSAGSDRDAEEREFIETLLPEAIKGGAVKLVDTRTDPH